MWRNDPSLDADADRRAASLRRAGAAHRSCGDGTDDVRRSRRRAGRGRARTDPADGARRRQPRPGVFDDPHQLRLDRPNAGRHTAFSAGIHYCLGASLAKLEAQVAITRLIRRFDIDRTGRRTPLARPHHHPRRRPPATDRLLTFNVVSDTTLTRHGVVEQCDQRAGVPTAATPGDDLLIELVDHRSHGQADAEPIRLRRGRSPRSLRIHSTANPNSNSPAAIVRARFSICQLPAAPFEIVSTTSSMSRPGPLRERDALRQTLQQPGDADLVDHLRGLTCTGAPEQAAFPCVSP